MHAMADSGLNVDQPTLDCWRKASAALFTQSSTSGSLCLMPVNPTNVGAFLAPLVCGTLGERVGWHYGFAVAGIGMLIALTTYLVATPHLPPDPLFADAKSPDAHRPMNRQEWHAVIALLLLFLRQYDCPVGRRPH
jgi:dipeptide/tripeptide permease